MNPPFAVGPAKPVATVSDVVATGGASAPAHRLTPAFVFGGNQPFAGEATELYRVHVFTDQGCVNRVYSSSIVGSPAYAPRFSGALALPNTAGGVVGARGIYLADGLQGATSAADGEKINGQRVARSSQADPRAAGRRHRRPERRPSPRRARRPRLRAAPHLHP